MHHPMFLHRSRGTPRHIFSACVVACATLSILAATPASASSGELAARLADYQQFSVTAGPAKDEQTKQQVMAAWAQRLEEAMAADPQASGQDLDLARATLGSLYGSLGNDLAAWAHFRDLSESATADPTMRADAAWSTFTLAPRVQRSLDERLRALDVFESAADAVAQRGDANQQWLGETRSISAWWRAEALLAEAGQGGPNAAALLQQAEKFMLQHVERVKADAAFASQQFITDANLAPDGSMFKLARTQAAIAQALAQQDPALASAYSSKVIATLDAYFEGPRSGRNDDNAAAMYIRQLAATNKIDPTSAERIVSIARANPTGHAIINAMQEASWATVQGSPEGSPNHAAARRIALTLMELSEKWFPESYATMPNYLTSMCTVARSYIKEGDFAAANQWLDKLRATNPTDQFLLDQITWLTAEINNAYATVEQDVEHLMDKLDTQPTVQPVADAAPMSDAIAATDLAAPMVAKDAGEASAENPAVTQAAASVPFRGMNRLLLAGGLGVVVLLGSVLIVRMVRRAS